METINWGGPQWVLITILAFRFLTGIAVRVVFFMELGKTARQQIGSVVADAIKITTLFLILNWGGFWA